MADSDTPEQCESCEDTGNDSCNDGGEEDDDSSADLQPSVLILDVYIAFADRKSIEDDPDKMRETVWRQLADAPRVPEVIIGIVPSGAGAFEISAGPSLSTAAQGSEDKYEELKDAVAGAGAARLEDWLWRNYKTTDVVPIVKVAGVLDDTADQLRSLVEDPVRALASAADVRGWLTEAGGSVAAFFVMGPLAEPLEKGALICEIAGLVIGLVSANPILIAASSKALLHDALSDLLSEGLKGVISPTEALEEDADPTVLSRGDSHIDRLASLALDLSALPTPTGEVDGRFTSRIGELLDECRGADPPGKIVRPVTSRQSPPLW